VGVEADGEQGAGHDVRLPVVERSVLPCGQAVIADYGIDLNSGIREG
jgi:hypothetical protein